MANHTIGRGQSRSVQLSLLAHRKQFVPSTYGCGFRS